MAALAELTVLVVLDEGEAEPLRRRVREYQRAHPGPAPAAAAGRLSVNGAPALPAYELTHICCRRWSTLERLAPSLARRYSDSEPDGPPPKRRRYQGDGNRASAAADERCWLVTAQWLEQTLRTGERQPERDHALPQQSGAAPGPSARGPARRAAGGTQLQLQRRKLVNPTTGQPFADAWYIHVKLSLADPLPSFDELWQQRPDKPDLIEVGWGSSKQLKPLPRLTQAYNKDYHYSRVRVRPAKAAPPCIQNLLDHLNALLGTDFNGGELSTALHARATSATS